jgi:hypothetical protein
MARVPSDWIRRDVALIPVAGLNRCPRRAVRAGIKTRFITAADLMLHLAAAHGQGRLKEYFNRAMPEP